MYNDTQCAHVITENHSCVASAPVFDVDKWVSDTLAKHASAEMEYEACLMDKMRVIVDADITSSDDLRENSNTNAETAMGAMLKAGSEALKQYYLAEMIDPEIAEAHKSGLIHIHDLDFYGFTATCLQLNLGKLYEDGFFTGQGTVRTPQSIRSYWSLLCIAIQASQNDMHGGQSIPMLEYYLAPGVAKTFAKTLATAVLDAHDLWEEYGTGAASAFRDAAMSGIFKKHGTLLTDEALTELTALCLQTFGIEPTEQQVRMSVMKTVDECLQGAEASIHNLCTMASRAGAQVPFSSVNYGTGTLPEQRMVIGCILQALEAGLGNGESPIFPIHIFKVKAGINYNPGDPNYDLFKKALAVTGKRMFPNYLFLDAPFNLQYYVEGDPDTEVASMGCRTRVIGNVNGPSTTAGRGNLSFTTVNLPRLAILAGAGNVDAFFEQLDSTVALCIKQLLDRYDVQCNRKAKNFPMLFGNHMYMGSDNIEAEDHLGDALKHGTLSVGYVGLAEALVALTGEHHGESDAAQVLGLRIIGRMRELLDEATAKYSLNFSLLATPAESTAGTLLRKDRQKFGVIPGVTDKAYYTNSNHVPVGFDIEAKRKIELEAPYHALTNAGHITYIEFPGDPSANPEAMETIVRWMHDAGTGYGAINLPIDTCMSCGYTGSFGTCPECGNDDETKIHRLRRITGYLVGDMRTRFNDGKKAEAADRVKHHL